MTAIDAKVCPIVLGHTKGVEKALVYQFAGESSSGLPRDGVWKCFDVSKMKDVTLRDGPWRTGTAHRQAQTCVETVDRRQSGKPVPAEAAAAIVASTDAGIHSAQLFTA